SGTSSTRGLTTAGPRYEASALPYARFGRVSARLLLRWRIGLVVSQNYSCRYLKRAKLGCAFSDRVVYPEFFADNPDSRDPKLQSPCGVYREGCGLRHVHLSWGHDEYLYHVVKDHLPEPALYMIRYHSIYAWHREGEYGHLLDEDDRRMLEWVQ